MFSTDADNHLTNLKDLLRQQLKNLLEEHVDFDAESNLIEYGVNSIQIMQISNKLRKVGIKVTFSQLISNPTLKEWDKLIDEKQGKKEIIKSKNEKFFKKRHFPLTDTQYAYWVGRMDDQPLGGVGCHAYLEIDGKGVEPERLERAWSKLLAHHPMLRARFSDDGRQEIMDKPYMDKLMVHDLRECNQSELEVNLIEIREKLSHRKLSVEDGQVIGLELSILPENYTRIHFDVDLLVADLHSLRVILRDLAAAYAREKTPPAQVDWNFGEYLKSEEQRRRQDREEAKQYWEKRLPTLPFAPSLPLSNSPEIIKTPVFKRRRYFLEKEEWNLLKKYAAINQVTPAMVLLTAYAEILERWSGNSHFLINIPLFDRQTEEYDIEDVVADFTNLILFEVRRDSTKTFLQAIKSIQSQFHQDVAYTAYSGVNIQRDLARLHAGQRFFAPVVFACNLGEPLINEECSQTFGKLTYMISQTPQVWLDFQIYEENNGLLLVWDVVEELFPEGLIDDMFSACSSLIKWLAGSENWDTKIDVLPKEQQKRRSSDIELILPLPEPTKCLHTDFFENKKPEKIALIDSHTNRQISYKELLDYALRVANLLKQNSIGRNDAVAITLPRGIDQIAGVLGILAVGAYYVPISIEQPDKRRETILQKLGIKYVLSDLSRIENTHWLEHAITINIHEAVDITPLDDCVEMDPESTAYIILTSGSTGEPKGVEVSHYSAWNTISDINQRYNVGENDCLLAVSSLDFDLSVYDIFGMLSVCGKIVLIPDEARRDSSHWLNCINQYHVTFWNSVPVLLDMLLTTAESLHKVKLPLRMAILSGDWIGLELPARLKNIAPCHLVAMGGATEAAIWSNYFDVDLLLPACWKSIPYGRPLKHQVYRVVDEEGRDCPDWVSGELWIGGAGIAKGYKNDENLTREKFISINGLRWYKTGDRGRFWPDGTIEFLGRKDYQVKIRGHRIELGEIEASLQNHPYVKAAVTIVLENEKSNRYLAGYVIPDANKKECLSEDILKNYLKQLLPEYMVPPVIVLLDELPLTANGKLDRKKLAKEKIQDTNFNMAEKNLRNLTKLEQILRGLWEQELNLPNIGVEDNFFALGGDSLIATRIVAKIQEQLSIKLSIINIFEIPTILKLSQYIEKLNKNNTVLKDSQLLTNICNRSLTDYDESNEEIASLVIFAEGKQENNPMKVLFHTGTGNLTIYNALLPLIINHPQQTDTIAGIMVKNQNWLIDIPADRLVETLGNKYAKILLRQRASSFELVGHCIGGLIAMETAKVLIEAGVDVKPVVLINSTLNKQANCKLSTMEKAVLNSEILIEKMFGYLIGADVRRTGYLISDDTLMKALKNYETIENGTFKEEDLCLLEDTVGDCYRQLLSKSQFQRLRGLYNTIQNVNDEQEKMFDKAYLIFKHNFKATFLYKPLPFSGNIHVMKCIDKIEDSFMNNLDIFSNEKDIWEGIVEGKIKFDYIKGNHFSCLKPPCVSSIFDKLSRL